MAEQPAKAERPTDQETFKKYVETLMKNNKAVRENFKNVLFSRNDALPKSGLGLPRGGGLGRGKGLEDTRYKGIPEHIRKILEDDEYDRDQKMERKQ